MTAEDLKALSRKIKGSDFWPGDDGDGGRFDATPAYCQWEDSQGDMGQIINADDNESPAECFDLLDRMEAAGFNIQLHKRIAGDFAAFKWLCQPEDNCLGIGKTRTEAIVKLAIAVLPDVVEG